MDFNSSSPYPEGIISFLDTDLYKLTMQCAVLKYFGDVHVSYRFTNRTPDKKLSRKAFTWLEDQINKLGNISLSVEELQYLRQHCPYLSMNYVDFLKDFHLRPRDQVVITFEPAGEDTGSESDIGDIDIRISGKWLDTILYEIPVLSLTSEAYFKFMETDWNYDGQEDVALEKGMRLLEAGCVFSEFGTRRRRDYHTQALVFRGLTKAGKEAEKRGLRGRLSGTSNVHLAMRFGISPVGTVAHEWFMGIAAILDDYPNANEEALIRWVDCFGEGVLGIALTDTFGTPNFLKAFSKPVRHLHEPPKPERRASRADHFIAVVDGVNVSGAPKRTYAELFTGVRQDSGDPKNFVKLMRSFYDEQGIKDKKVIVFSDSLNIDSCLEYKQVAEEAGFQPTFGVGTFFTNDFIRLSTGKKSAPLNIVIKLSMAGGKPAVKIRLVGTTDRTPYYGKLGRSDKLISDNIGKNTGDMETVVKVKRELGYQEKEWPEGDETSRWGGEGEARTV